MKYLSILIMLALACGSGQIDPNSDVYQSIQDNLDYGDPFHWFKMQTFSNIGALGKVSAGDTVWASDSCVFVAFYGGSSFGVERYKNCDRLDRRSTALAETLHYMPMNPHIWKDTTAFMDSNWEFMSAPVTKIERIDRVERR